MYTAAEVRVIHELIKGLNNTEIAKNLNCAEKTVKFHLHKINKKSNTRSRGEFIAHYYKACLKNKIMGFNFAEPTAQCVVALFKSLNYDPDILPRGKAS